MRVLVPPQAIDPRTTHQAAVEHDVYFLAVVPGLRVLVTVALDADVLVDDHHFDMAVALLLFGDDRVGLVFADVPEVVETGLRGGGEGSVEFVGDHLVGAALFGEELALGVLAEFLGIGKRTHGVVVAETYVAVHVYSSLARFNDSWDERLSVQCR